MFAADTLLVIVGEYGVEDGTEDPARLAEYGEKSGRMNLIRVIFLTRELGEFAGATDPEGGDHRYGASGLANGKRGSSVALSWYNPPKIILVCVSQFRDSFLEVPRQDVLQHFRDLSL